MPRKPVGPPPVRIRLTLDPASLLHIAKLEEFLGTGDYTRHVEGITERISAAMAGMGDKKKNLLAVYAPEYSGQLKSAIDVKLHPGASELKVGSAPGGLAGFKSRGGSEAMYNPGSARLPNIEVGLFPSQADAGLLPPGGGHQVGLQRYYTRVIRGGKGASSFERRPDPDRVYGWIESQLGISRHTKLGRAIYWGIWQKDRKPYDFIADAIADSDWEASEEKAREQIAVMLTKFLNLPFEREQLAPEVPEEEAKAKPASKRKPRAKAAPKPFSGLASPAGRMRGQFTQEVDKAGNILYRKVGKGGKPGQVVMVVPLAAKPPKVRAPSKPRVYKPRPPKAKPLSRMTESVKGVRVGQGPDPKLLKQAIKRREAEIARMRATGRTRNEDGRTIAQLEITLRNMRAKLQQDTD